MDKHILTSDPDVVQALAQIYFNTFLRVFVENVPLLGEKLRLKA